MVDEIKNHNVGKREPSDYQSKSLETSDRVPISRWVFDMTCQVSLNAITLRARWPSTRQMQETRKNDGIIIRKLTIQKEPVFSLRICQSYIWSGQDKIERL